MVLQPILDGYLNTSNVDIKHQDGTQKRGIYYHLNTSNVDIKQQKNLQLM